MNCRFVRQNLVNILDQALDTEMFDACMRHRRECAGCHRLLARTEEAWREWDPARDMRVSPYLVSRVLEHTEHANPVQRMLRVLQSNWQIALQPVVATLLVAGAVWLGAFLGGADEYDEDTQLSSMPSSYYDVLTAYPGGSVADFLHTDSDVAEGRDR